ncbi:MAG: hypothetical protein OEZ02_00760 [Anaerolineae bacterium]|nr:hypothetical protein [Anaerolineae bacterium]
MLDFTPPQYVSRVIVLLISLTIHELAHAWTADYLGDNTPRQKWAALIESLRSP